MTVYYKAVRLDGTSHYDKKTVWTPGVEISVDISEKALFALPGHHFLRFEEVTDMDGHKRPAVIWQWRDGAQYRIAAFDTRDGEYLGEQPQ